MTLAWGRGKRRATPDPEPAAPIWPVLAELEVYTAATRLVGWIAPEGERTSDWMNRSNELELIGAVEAGLDEPRPDLQEPGAGAARVRVAASEILLAVPPSLPAGRHLRLHRRILQVRFQLEGYDLSGQIHVRPGAEVGDYLLRSNRIFVPITEAELVHQRDPQFVRLLPVVIMNVRHVSRIHLMDAPRDAAPASPSAAPGSVRAAGAAPPDAAAGAAPHSAPPAPSMEASARPSFTFNDVEPMEGSVHRALSELLALRRDGLVSDAEFEVKRSEILSRL